MGKKKEKKNKKKNAEASVKKQRNKSGKKALSMRSAETEISVTATGKSSISPGSASENSKPRQNTQKNRSSKGNAPKNDFLKSSTPEKSKKPPIVDTVKRKSPETAIQMLPVFQALSDENRLKIINLLSVRERTTPELLELVDVVQSTMSHHLKILTEAGLISCRKQGKRSCYSIRPDTFAQIEAYFASRISSATGTEKQ